LKHLRILVFNPIDDEGHLNLWHSEIVKTLTDQGHEIVLVNPRNFLDLAIFEGVALRNEERLTPDYEISAASFTRKIINLFKKILGKKIYRIIRSLLKGQSTNYKSSTSDNGFSSPLGFYRQIALNNLFEKKIDLIFYTYFDFFTDEFLDKFPEIDELLGIPWVALLFDPKQKQIEKINKSPNCQGIGAIDETCFDKLSRDLNIQVILVTDFVIDTSNIDRLKISGTKKTVSLIGTLSERKNLDLFLSAVFSSEGKKYNWLLHGKLHTNNLKLMTKLRIFRIKHYKHKNIMFNFSYLTDADFNKALFNTNFMFLAYKNWMHASNLLTHSVLHRIPVIAFNEGEIGKLVNEYSLGAILTGNKKENVFQALDLLSEHNLSEGNLSSFLERFSRNNFAKSIANLLSEENFSGR
jgi:glycosyltransferase involved in cell wall biosynthesis